ncbi:MAG: dihydropteroate synthase [Prevotellaceae bacterium]|jgi:dihydropteroate synthase|nr:dihydropteroate synthase [Prevotellaceae bacterium]
MQIKLYDKLLDLSSPVVMAIINVTPDSFYKNSRTFSDQPILQTVEKALGAGARIVDLGGYSTRPSAEDVTQEEEIRRLSQGLDVILKEFPDTSVSIDTFRSGTVRNIVKNYAVSMVNDIGGGTLDDLMFETVGELKVAYVLMHMRGTPKTMHECTDYDNLTGEVIRFLNKQIAQLRALGVVDIVIDPGFGFAKTTAQNYELLKNMSCLKELDCPILAGVSRKSMICKLLDVDPTEALNGTTAVNMLALMNGASILRVHDVKEAVETVRIYNQYIQS